MPSHLSRLVFRRLLANEPILYRGCVRRRQYSSVVRASKSLRPALTYDGVQDLPVQQARSFFNLNIFAKKDERKEADMDPGIDKMMELAKRQRMSARMPPIEDVVLAITQFVTAKRRHKKAMKDTQAQYVLQSLRYYFKAVKEKQDQGEALPHLLGPAELRKTAKVLMLEGEPLSAAHTELAALLYEETHAPGQPRLLKTVMLAYVKILSLTGSTSQAQKLVLQWERDNAASESSSSQIEDVEADSSDLAEQDEMLDHVLDPTSLRAWSIVLQGFALEGNDAEVQNTLARTIESSAISPRVAKIMLEYSLRRDDPAGVRHWWDTYRERAMKIPSTDIHSATRMGHQLHQVLKWCLARNNLDTGHAIVKEVMTTNPSKPLWDAIFMWAAGTKRSVDEIDRMMAVMEKSNETILDTAQWRTPDVATINGLVEHAISNNDPYMAERFIALGRDRNIEPDAQTYVLQMDYRLSVGDVDGALIAYKNLQSMDLSSNEDAKTVNRLVVALCKSQRHDSDTIMNVAGDLSDRRLRFEPDTVSALSLLHLSRDEEHDVVDLLNTHAFHYASGEREQVRSTLVNFCLDPSTSTSQAWQAYNTIRSIFDETPRDVRTELMTSFFTRERTDMGVRVFQNMRMHTRADTIPTVDTYVACFMGLAKLRDLESVEVVHNLLKLDYNITPTTYLRNSLIVAYTACGKGRKAMGFWDDIVASKEGPSYNSIHVALRSCEKSPFGDWRAKDLWQLLRRRNVELDQALWSSYVAALAGNGDNDLAIGTVEEAEAKGELEVDSFLLGSLFAGAGGQVKQTEIEAWGREKYPVQWAELEKFGEDSDEVGMRTFRIDRRVAP
ncbi:hypothetical protein LTR37_011147 [Vermiconidia calcicola]|uniref:Uncharacterized protein n=1 Tax=Vermiconidia calcicola TaxID=1690605 RepID=A0ACC3N2Z1_9PEZI|nr:hypothetical protein LTR37_011147 [Vermiconidia calcicola]